MLMAGAVEDGPQSAAVGGMLLTTPVPVWLAP
jgi:hypothetical protein